MIHIQSLILNFLHQSPKDKKVNVKKMYERRKIEPAKKNDLGSSVLYLRFSATSTPTCARLVPLLSQSGAECGLDVHLVGSSAQTGCKVIMSFCQLRIQCLPMENATKLQTIQVLRCLPTRESVPSLMFTRSIIPHRHITSQ